MSNRRFLFSGSGNGERLKFYPNMKAIIAEKPSVGMDIARVVGATEKKDGYCIGNGYMVTWALGHLVSLALPGTYGYTKTAFSAGRQANKDGQRYGDRHNRQQTAQNH